jgi:hypothetical protein
MTKMGGYCSLMGQTVLLRLSDAVLSGASVLYVLVWHLMGFIWVQGGLVETAVSRGSTACYRIRAIICSLPRASLPLGSSFRPPIS